MKGRGRMSDPLNRKINKKARLMLYVFCSALLTVFLYVLLHEVGHMLVMLCAGSTITEFSIIGAHVCGEGGVFTYFLELWHNANGVLLPLLLSYIYALFYRREKKSPLYRVLSFFVCSVPASSMLAWVILPFVYLNGTAPAGDDVTKFLNFFSWNYHPLTVSAAAAVLIGISVFLMIKKRVLRNFIEAIKASRA